MPEGAMPEGTSPEMAAPGVAAPEGGAPDMEPFEAGAPEDVSPPNAPNR